MKTLNNNNRQKLLAYFGLAIVTLIVGLSFIFVKIGLRSADTYDLLAHRFSFAFLVVLTSKAFGIVKIPKLAAREKVWIILISLFYPILFFSFQTIGMETSTASQAGLIFALSPIITIVAGIIFLKEKTTLVQKAGVIISVTSLVLVFTYNSGESSISWIGSIFLLLSVTCIVGYYIIGKNLMKRLNSLSITAIMITIAFIVFNSIAFTKHFLNGDLGAYFIPLSEPTYLYSVLYLGILSSLFTSFLSNYALAYVPTSEVSIFNNLNPIITILGGVILLGEQLYVFQIIGTTGVILGISLVLIKRKKITKSHKYRKSNGTPKTALMPMVVNLNKIKGKAIRKKENQITN